MEQLNNYRLNLGQEEYVPIVVGGMGVDISTTELAHAACKLGGIGHISDAMVPFVSDKKFRTNFSAQKGKVHKATVNSFDKTNIKFNLEHIKEAQRNHVEQTMNGKKGPGGIFINVMEKLTMGGPGETIQARIEAAMDAGIDGITLSAGLHTGTLKLVEDHPRFRDVKFGIIVSSARALKIFLRSSARLNRMPDYVIVEGPLAGGHLGFGEDWKKYNLTNIVIEVVEFLKKEELNIPVIPAGGVFTGTDAVELIKKGASAVQVATRFTITEECGLPSNVKQKYFEAREEQIIVSSASPTGYLIRMLDNSPCLTSGIKPNCEALGYLLSKEGTCQYVDAYREVVESGQDPKQGVSKKTCLCYHFSKYNCWTCGHNVYRLKDTTNRLEDGSYQLLRAEHVFNDYLYSQDHSISLPEPTKVAIAS